MRSYFRAGIIFITLTTSLFAAEARPISEKGGVIFPIIFSTPETGVGYGFTTIAYQGTAYSPAKNDIWQLIMFGTQKRQSLYALTLEKYYSDRKLLASLFSNGDNSKYYGIGQDSHLQDEEIYVQYIVNFRSSLLFDINSKFSFGPSIAIGRYDLLEVSENAALVDSELIGLNGTIVSGLGYTLHHDSRDNNIYPVDGQLFNFKQLFYQKAVGSDHDFSAVDIDYRSYHLIGLNEVLAMRFRSVLSGGQVPFQLKPRLDIRGIYLGRYLDNNYLSVELEYRAPLIGRSKYTIFAGCGQVAEYIGDFTAEKIQSTYGFGLRYPMDRQGRVNLRVDLAFSREENFFYVNLMEAF